MKAVGGHGNEVIGRKAVSGVHFFKRKGTEIRNAMTIPIDAGRVRTFATWYVEY